MVAEVIVDIAHSEVDKVFDYDCRTDTLSAGSRVIVPFGNMKIEGVVIRLKETSNLPKEKLKPVIRVFDEQPAITKELLELANDMREKYHVTMASILRFFLPAEMRKGKVKEKLVTYVSVKSDISFDEVLASIPQRAKQQRAAFQFMRDVKICKIADLKRDFSNSSVNALIEAGYLFTTKERESRTPYAEIEAQSKSITLTDEQCLAISSVDGTGKTVTLIHGVTGSGKTAVYLRLIREAVEKGKTAIMLVPEISLTPQMFRQLRAEFGDTAAILHSGLSAGERFDEWQRLRRGEAKIAIGARSAIFAPLENLGIIIIDEEHDGSYASESNPRYTTFFVAKRRAEYNGCKLVLGSATPSVEAYLAAKSGEFNLVKMKNRINKKPMPEIIISDMRTEVRKGNSSAFSSSLKAEIERCLQSGKQAIIFLNRRGYSRHVVCRECGYVAKCESCDVALNYHSVGGVLKCHYCGAAYKMLTACPECGGVHINYVGTGTQRVVEELKKLFPSARILRMDNDTTQNKDGHLKILESFSRREADILVGTQMIAKGHDFPSVTLVGILDADMSLFFSDYRSGERTFQLITQVAGRSGRADEKGTVVLQTYNPNNAILRYAVNYDYEGFFARELSLRKTTSYPPFATIVRVMIESDDEQKGLETLKHVYEGILEIKNSRPEAFIFFNKMKCPIKRIKNKHRYQVLMRLEKGFDAVLDEIYDASLPYSSKNTLVYVEINPSNLS